MSKPIFLSQGKCRKMERILTPDLCFDDLFQSMHKFKSTQFVVIKAPEERKSYIKRTLYAVFLSFFDQDISNHSNNTGS